MKPDPNTKVIVLVKTRKRKPSGRHQVVTAADLLASGLVGIWSGRKDIGDSLEFAQHLRQKAEHREFNQ